MRRGRVPHWATDRTAGWESLFQLTFFAVGASAQGGASMSEQGPLRAEFAVTEKDVYRFLVYGTLHSPSRMVRVPVYFLLLFGLTTRLIVTGFPGTQFAAAA